MCLISCCLQISNTALEAVAVLMLALNIGFFCCLLAALVYVGLADDGKAPYDKDDADEEMSAKQQNSTTKA